MQDAVDAITDTNVILQRFNVNIGGTLGDRFADNLVDKFYDRRFRIIGTDVGGGFTFL